MIAVLAVLEVLVGLVGAALPERDASEPRPATDARLTPVRNGLLIALLVVTLGCLVVGGFVAIANSL